VLRNNLCCGPSFFRFHPHPNLQFSRTSLQPSSLVKSTPCPHHCEDYNAHFTKGVKANVQLKSSIPIGAKIEISPKGLCTRSQG
jgi:hypothetical protein